MVRDPRYQGAGASSGPGFGRLGSDSGSAHRLQKDLTATSKYRHTFREGDGTWEQTISRLDHAPLLVVPPLERDEPSAAGGTVARYEVQRWLHAGGVMLVAGGPFAAAFMNHIGSTDGHEWAMKVRRPPSTTPAKKEEKGHQSESDSESECRAMGAAARISLRFLTRCHRLTVCGRSSGPPSPASSRQGAQCRCCTKQARRRRWWPWRQCALARAA